MHPTAQFAAESDHQWWVAPAVCTPVALTLVYVDNAMIPLPLPWSLGLLVPFALVAACWLVPPTRAHRQKRIGLGATACVFALLYSKALMVVVYVVAIAAWLMHGD